MPSSSKTVKLTVGALGVVFGDIGTSPIYALRECLAPGRGIELAPGPILGVVSLLVWTLILVVCVKYLAVVLRADNHGEGGVLALISLLAKPGLIFVGMVGAALLYADGVLTPAVSVLSALEGLNLLSASFQPWVVPASVAVLVVLFAAQALGTSRIAAWFGPIIIVWFVVLGLLGIQALSLEPRAWQALNPAVALDFAVGHPVLAFGVLGYVFLAVTGTEALYADMGHFGKAPIRWGWYVVAFPALILNYLGQGATVLADPTKVDNLFFQLAPAWALTPLILLATVATVIASQAVISGAFSLARQSVQLGFWPRMTVRHTSNETEGQIYVPLVNALLLVGTLALVLFFRESGKLADAYGIAVSGTMLLTTGLLVAVARTRWSLPWWAIAPLGAAFLAVDLVFFSANATKLFTGGWVVLAMAAGLLTIMLTWRTGRLRLRSRSDARAVEVEAFLESVNHSSTGVHRVSRPAVYLAGNPNGVPPALLHNLKHNQVLHHPLLILTVETVGIPVVDPADRARVVNFAHGVSQVRLAFGFGETPDIPAALIDLDQPGFDARTVTYFMGKENLTQGTAPGMAAWRKRLFLFLAQNATEITTYFQLPPGQVVEIGGRSEI